MTLCALDTKCFSITDTKDGFLLNVVGRTLFATALSYIFMFRSRVRDTDMVRNTEMPNENFRKNAPLLYHLEYEKNSKKAKVLMWAY